MRAASATTAHGPADASARLVGGRFWALAEGCSDGEADEEDARSPVTPVVVGSPTPSDQLCEFLVVGYLEQEVAGLVDYAIDDADSAREGLGNGEKDVTEVLRRVVFRRTSSSALRPWKGPLPKSRPRGAGDEQLRGPSRWAGVESGRAWTCMLLVG